MKNRFVFCVVFFTFVCMFTGCRNSYEKMINDFNEEYFEKGYLPPEPYTTGTTGFQESFMLDDIISMKEDSITVLIAPDGGESCSYEWKALVPCKDSHGKYYMKPAVIGNKRTLKYKAPGVFSSDKENKLVLTVTEVSGKQYRDTAKIFIEIE